MGIYLFKRDALLDLLNARPLATDFGKEIFPRSIADAPRAGAPVRRLLGRPRHGQILSRGQPGPGRRRSAVRFPQPRGRHLHAHALPAGLAHQRRQPGAVPHQRRLRHPGAATTSEALRRRRAQPDRQERDASRHVLIGADRFETDRRHARPIGAAACPTSASATAASSSGPSSTRIAASAATCRLSTSAACKDDEGENYVIRDGIVTIPRGTIIPDGTVI